MIQYSVWDLFDDDVWLSAPNAILHAEHKLTQLQVAARIGFSIPTTVVSNGWEPINNHLPAEIVFKPSYGMMYERNALRILYTSRLRNPPIDLPRSAIPFPGFWQPYLSKSREWRVTFVGDDSFDAAIYTDMSAKDDWRKHQLDDGVTFRAEPFPDREKDLCREYLNALGLRFGAFDFIEDPEGQIHFLECNANGQFGWLEDDLGFQISEAIAGVLRRIARGQ